MMEILMCHEMAHPLRNFTSVVDELFSWKPKKETQPWQQGKNRSSQ
jgi:hypothetical protein